MQIKSKLEVSLYLSIAQYGYLEIKQDEIVSNFECELAQLVALQGESSWKGAAAAAWGDLHWKVATCRLEAQEGYKKSNFEFVIFVLRADF